MLSFDDTLQTHFLTEYSLTEQMDDLAKSKEPDVTMSCQGSPKTAGRFFHISLVPDTLERLIVIRKDHMSAFPGH